MGLGVFSEFFEGVFIGFNKGKVFIMSNGETDCADASIEVKNLVGSDMFFDFFEGKFVDGKVDLEKAVRRIGVGFRENLVG